MGTHRMMPPATADGGSTTTKVNGRSYTCAPGATIDVPDFDGEVLKVNGWSAAAVGGAGATATRPAFAAKTNVGFQFYDATLGKSITWDGRAWRDPATGAAV